MVMDIFVLFFLNCGWICGQSWRFNGTGGITWWLVLSEQMIMCQMDWVGW